MIPLISIIIPTFNRAHIIGETLDSIIAQSYTNWECIIVDDGSTDDTEVVIAEYINNDSRFKFYKRPKHREKGPNSCRNFGFEKSKGNLIHWFDSDDLLFNNALELYLKEFENAPKTDVVISKLQLIEMETNLVIKENSIFSNNLIQDYFVGKIAFYVSGPMWSKDFLLQQKELFSEDIMNLDDWDFNLRMLYANPKIVFIEIPLIKYRVHSNSLSHEVGKLNIDEIKSEFKAREKHINLLAKSKKIDSLMLKKFIILRYKFLLREALTSKNKIKYYLLLNLTKKQLELFNIIGVFRTLIGFSIFSIFNVGYKLIK